jgi:TIR domain
MASPREYFDKDSSQNLRVHATHTSTNKMTGETVEVIAAVSFDFDAGAKFALLYIPDVPFADHIVAHYLHNINDVLKVGDGVSVATGFAETAENIPSTDLTFTGRITVYTARRFNERESTGLATLAKQRGLKLVIRDAEYLAQRSKMEKPLAFISHDTRDKEPFVRELASKLQAMLCPVWYDDYTLIAGQSLRASIEKGLKECRKCVLILSPNFLSNEGWTKAEFDSVFTREILEAADVIIPVWHGVEKQDVYNYSPRLLDKVGIPSTLGTEEVARRILRAINHVA